MFGKVYTYNDMRTKFTICSGLVMAFFLNCTGLNAEGSEKSYDKLTTSNGLIVAGFFIFFDMMTGRPCFECIHRPGRL